MACLLIVENLAIVKVTAYNLFFFSLNCKPIEVISRMLLARKWYVILGYLSMLKPLASCSTEWITIIKSRRLLAVNSIRLGLSFICIVVTSVVFLFNDSTGSVPRNTYGWQNAV